MTAERRDLLWEIGMEEVPARFIPAAVKQLAAAAGEALREAGLAHEGLRVYATPRRLTLLVNGLSGTTADKETEQRGPSRKAAYDENGAPTRALLGFCKSQGLDPQDLIEREVNGNLYLFACKRSPGQPALQVLPDLLRGIAEGLSFPKPMRWGYQTRRFVRPVRWMVALFGQEVVDLEFAGIHADRFSRGHRLLGSDHIELAEPAEYLPKLRENYVICDQDERRALCWQQILAEADRLGGHVEEDEELLTEVTYLLEYPTALSGHFEEKYLAMPQELVITPMREHQRYFPVYAADGSLLPRFITVRNGNSRFLATVAEGNEKVLRARLADAEFFYHEDLADRMEDKVEELSQVVFHEKLGTMRQKVARMVKLAEEIGHRLGYTAEEMTQVQRAAYLAKADLGSRVVYEFPELQGIIGEYYAKAAGEDPVVAQAIREHYLPRFAGDALPETKAGVAVALADKLDSICGFFAIGMVPSGSQDPYALRRAAAGCVQIIDAHALRLPLRELLPVAFALVEADVSSAAKQNLLAAEERLELAVRFLQQRLANLLAEKGVEYDIVNAVEQICILQAEFYGAACRAHALHNYRAAGKLAPLMAGFTRVANLLRSGVQKQTDGLPCQVEMSLFQDESERALFAALQVAEEKAAPLLIAGDYSAVLDAAAELTPSINAFFDAVMVMDEDPAVRGNRLALLQRLAQLPAAVGDLSKLVG